MIKTGLYFKNFKINIGLFFNEKNNDEKLPTYWWKLAVKVPLEASNLKELFFLKHFDYRNFFKEEIICRDPLKNYYPTFLKTKNQDYKLTFLLPALIDYYLTNKVINE